MRVVAKSGSWWGPPSHFAECVLAVSSRGKEQREEESSIMSLFYKEALTPFMRALPSCPNYILTPHLLIVSHWNWGGAQTIQSVIVYKAPGPCSNDIERQYSTSLVIPHILWEAWAAFLFQTMFSRIFVDWIPLQGRAEGRFADYNTIVYTKNASFLRKKSRRFTYGPLENNQIS